MFRTLLTAGALCALAAAAAPQRAERGPSRGPAWTPRLIAAGPASAADAAPAARGGTAAVLPRNVLLIVGDDFGRERLAAYGIHPSPAATPVMDQLIQAGVLFDNAYSQMVCSPTRAAMLTGQHAFRTGIGTSVPWKNCENSENGCFDLDVEHTPTLPRALRGTHRSAAFGKWHLSTYREGRGWMHPIRAGFDTFKGAKQNLGGSQGSPSLYYEWEKNVAYPTGAHQFTATKYATTDNVDDALAFIERQDDQPWFTWLAFNAAHTPFHVPPPELAPQTGATEDSPDWVKQKAMIEAMDTEIGRLLTSLRPAVLKRTWIIFLADNGPPPSAIQAPYPLPGKAKPNPWEGNIHVPMFVVGPDLVAPGRRVEHLVHVVDVFASVCEMAGVSVPPSAVDSVSFLDYLLDPEAPTKRPASYSERFRPNGAGPYNLEQWAITDGRWKLGVYGGFITLPGGGAGLSFFDLLNDPDETLDLLDGPGLTAEQQAAFDALMAERDAILAASP